jgi:MFS family permease
MLDYFKRLLNFLNRQSRNFKILMTKRIGNDFIKGISTQYTALYQRALGANLLQLGLLNSLGSFFSGVLSIPLGILIDRYSIKKIFLIVMGLEILVPVLYIFASNWTMLIPAVILSAISMSISASMLSIYIANSLEDRDRASGFGLILSLSKIGGFFITPIAAYLIILFGGINVDGIRPLYYFEVGGLCLLSIFVFFKIQNEQTNKNERVWNFPSIKDLSNVFRDEKGVTIFIALDILNTLVSRLSFPFMVIFAVEVKGATPSILAYAWMAAAISEFLFSFPIGRLADKIGRKKTVFLTRPFLWAFMISLVFAPNHVWVIMAWAFAGFPVMQVLWGTISMEIVSKEKRGRWTGSLALIRTFTSIPTFLLGGWLWETFGPTLPFLLAIGIDILIRMPILIFLPETLKRKS